MTNEEIKKKINAQLMFLTLKRQRQILWEILQMRLIEDPEGLRWFYSKLKDFIEDEFAE
jgi:hypothetical protein